MRAAMEKRIGLIAEGRAQFDSVLQDEIELYRSKFEWFVKKVYKHKNKNRKQIIK